MPQVRSFLAVRIDKPTKIDLVSKFPNISQAAAIRVLLDGWNRLPAESKLAAIQNTKPAKRGKTST
jgi:hypothetical protein